LPAGFFDGSCGSGWARRFFEAVETAERVGVRGLGLVARRSVGDDEEDFLFDVVEGEDLIEEHGQA